jgi:hypothetical protein
MVINWSSGAKPILPDSSESCIFRGKDSFGCVEVTSGIVLMDYFRRRLENSS